VGAVFTGAWHPRTVPQGRADLACHSGQYRAGAHAWHVCPVLDVASRRTASSHALDHALDRARALSRPLVVLEALRAEFAGGGITYLSYVEPAPGAGSGLLAALARRAAVIVTGNGLLPLRATDRAPENASALRRQSQRELAPRPAVERGATPVARRRPDPRLPAGRGASSARSSGRCAT
jgi:hypothetical protein